MSENLTNEEISKITAQNLAYLGDCVYELYVREYLCKKNVKSASVESLKFVTARVQSGIVEKILPLLDENEEDAYRRGRNLGHTSTPKSSTVGEYRRATGLEALFGWLYLGGRHDRLKELFELAFSEDTQAVSDEKTAE